MTTVTEATDIILQNCIEYGTEQVPFEGALGRVLAQSLVADRDFPPFDRVTMDGIAVRFDAFAGGQTRFRVEAVQAAGDVQQTLNDPTACIEVMTGASLPTGVDTVVRYEDIEIKDGVATVNILPKKAQNVHFKSQDRHHGDVIVAAGTRLGAAEIAIAATVGQTFVEVKKLPKVAVISSGDELVGVDQTPLEHQIRTSNVHAVASLLKNFGIHAALLHIADDLEATKQALALALQTHDVLVLSGGVSKGKKDFIPKALDALGVQKCFHRVSQQPGKPFWFGRTQDKVVFALPGNPVSTLACVRRYFVPWLRKSTDLVPLDNVVAMLDRDFTYTSPLTYFLQVKLYQAGATIMATPMVGNGSGDFANLVDTHGFMELPIEESFFEKGRVLPVWRFDYL